eukprot:1161653-Pelagomonas_calceolata.AAC.3
MQGKALPAHTHKSQASIQGSLFLTLNRDGILDDNLTVKLELDQVFFHHHIILLTETRTSRSVFWGRVPPLTLQSPISIFFHLGDGGDSRLS